MNKLCYRIVFNKARGMCMAVQETARSRSKGPGHGAAGSSIPAAMCLPPLRCTPYLLAIALGSPIFTGNALAQIVADPRAPGPQQATVLNAANGVLQVNIQTPSAGGVSRNVYSQFDVPKTGAVLNNSRSNTQTQLGGWVQGNPWLSKGTARVILNEVNSSNPSRLQGYIEVAGDRAETVIANPSGIVVDGGGFINVSRATLTTGSPTIEDGALKGYMVQRGQIVIEGAGLDASKTDYTALIARSLQVNAGLWAQQLNVITGANQVEEAARAKPTQMTQAFDGQPLFAVDVAHFGGMYANQIYLVGTEAGVGVRNAGEIGAVAGDLVVTANGRLENSGMLQASQSIQAKAREVANAGTMQARDSFVLAADSLANSGRIGAAVEASIKVQGDVHNDDGKIEAARIDIAGTTLRNARGNIVQTGSSALAIEASQVANVTGQMGRQRGTADSGIGGPAPTSDGVPGPSGAGDAPASSGNGGQQTNGGSPTGSIQAPALADGRLAFQSLDNTAGTIAANGATVVRADALVNRGGVAYLDSLSLSGTTFDNTAGTLAVLRSFTARTDTFVNDQGKLLVGATFDGELGSFSNRQGLVQGGQLAVDVKRNLDNSAGTLRQLGSGTADIKVGGELALDQATLETAAALRLQAGSISGGGSTLNVTGDLALASGETSTARSTWLVGGDAILRTGSLDNSGGKIAVSGRLSAASASLINISGTIAGATDVDITASGAVDNTRGVIQAAHDLAFVASGMLANRLGSIETLASDATMSVTGGAIDNLEGRITNAGTGKTALEAHTITNSGVIGGNGDLEIAANKLGNEDTANLISTGTMDLSVRESLVNAGRINAGRDFRMAQDKTNLDNHGFLVAQRNITITAAAIDNNSGQIATASGAGGSLSLQAFSAINRDGVIDADGQVQIDLQGNVSNERGHIRAGGDLALNAKGQIENSSGTIETAGRMQVSGGEIANDGGTIVAAGTLASSIEARLGIDNNGLIGANGHLGVAAQTLNNGALGTLSATGDLKLAIRNQLANRGGAISAAGSLNFNEANATLVNSGTIISAGDAHINIDRFDNDAGAVNTMSGASLAVTANGLSNRSGRIISGASAVVRATGDVDNERGILQAASSLDVGAGDNLINRGGVIETVDPYGTLALRAADLDNANGRIVNVGDGIATVVATGHLLNSGLIAGNGQLEVGAATMDNSGTVTSARGIELAVQNTLNNSGTISATAGLHTAQADASLRNSGTIVAGGPLELTLKAIDNTGGQIATAQGSNADVLLTAQNLSNRGGNIVSGRNAVLHVSDGLDNRSGLIQAKSELTLSAGGKLDTSSGGIETLSADSKLQLNAGTIVNDAGHIVNVGGGDTRIRADNDLVNNGEIAGNGALNLEAQHIVNQAHGSMSGAALALQARASLENAGDIGSRSTLAVDATGVNLRNSGQIIANGDITMHAAAIDNGGGTIATVGRSGAGVSLTGTSLSNHDGRIIADRMLTLGVSGALDNDRGIVLGSTSVKVTVDGDLSNDGGVIEVTDASASLALQANAINNGSGRIVNVGQGNTTVVAANSLESSGLIAGNGRVELNAANFANRTGGTLASGGAMAVAIGVSMDNTGTINSGANLDIDGPAAEIRNSGLIASSGALAVTSAALNNDGGQLATARQSGADLKLDAARLSNREGAILSDHDVHINSADAFDNTKGVLQAAGAMQLKLAGALGNDGGVIEALDPSASLILHAGSVNIGSGRMVNVGTGATTVSVIGGLSSAGTIAGNGSLTLTAAELDNRTGAILASGTSLEITASHAISNAGMISSQETLQIDASGAAVRNSGQVVSGARASLLADTFDNSDGQLATSADHGGDIALHAREVANVTGAIIAAGAAQITSSGGFDNQSGTVRANDTLAIEIGGALGNREGVIEAVGHDATLDVSAKSIDNTAGRLVNVGGGTSHFDAADSIVNSGILAGNGSVDLSAATVDNLAGGTIAAGGGLDLHASQRLLNAGAISTAGTLHIDEPAALIANSGRIAAANRIAMRGAAVSNDGGQIATQSGEVVLSSGSALSNRGGVIAAAGDATVTAQGSYDNSSGQVQTPGRLQVSIGGGLNNAGGALEAAGPGSTLDLQAAAIDNSAGRIVNAGIGPTSVTSASSIVNTGDIAGNGALNITATTLWNRPAGSINAGNALELAVTQAVSNQGGTISAGSTLHFDQAAASFSNSGQIGAGGTVDIMAATIANDGGLLYTVSGSDAALLLQAGSLGNMGGTIAADGLLRVDVVGRLSNNGGTLYGGRAATVEAGGALANGSGTIETAAGGLDIAAQSISSSGRILNAGSGAMKLTSAGAIFNSGIIAGNGTLDLHAAALQNDAAGQVASGAALLLDVREQLSNAGAVSSGGTLRFEQAGAAFTNSGQIAAARDIVLASASFNNDGGKISTVEGSGAGIRVTAPALSNRGGAILADGDAVLSFPAGADNSQGILQAKNNLALSTTGNVGNAGGVIEAVGAGSMLSIDGAGIDNGNGRVINLGSGDTRLTSLANIVNNGVIGAAGNLLLSGPVLENQADGIVASGGNMDLAITQQLTNQGKFNSAGTLTFNQADATFTNHGQVLSGGNAVITAKLVDNSGGQLGTAGGSGADLVLTSEHVGNESGRIATDRDLKVTTHSVSGAGELFSGRDLALAMDGDFVQAGAAQQFHSNRDLSLTVTGDITNASTFGALGTLTLSGKQITNQAGARIEGNGVVLKASGNLGNAGEINGVAAVDISAANVSNTGGIVGGYVSVATGNLDNTGSAALLGATGGLGLAVDGVLNNAGGATLYSSGDMAIGGQTGASVGTVNNISSSIEAGGNLALNASVLNNIRENVQIVKVKTVDETTHMSMPSWYQLGDNHNGFETSAANYWPHEIYFVNQADIIEDKMIVTPDGYTLHRAVIRTHANDSAFYIAASGLNSAYGVQQRLTLTEGTRVFYYREVSRAENPDQGGPASNVLAYAPWVTNWSSTVSFSNQYGSCSSYCLRIDVQPGYDDPGTTILRETVRSLAPVRDKLEVSRDAHHTVVEDQVAPDAGGAAEILAGGNMSLTVGSALNIQYGSIKARGTLAIGGGGTRNNLGAALYRTHTFDGTWRTIAGDVVNYQQPSISEAIGGATAVIAGGQGVIITGRSFNNVDVTAGTVGNIRDTVVVVGSGTTGAASANSHATADAVTGGPAAGAASASASGGHAVLAGAAHALSGSGALATDPSASASGVDNDARTGGTVTGSGYANDVAAAAEAQAGAAANGQALAGGAKWSGVTNYGRLAGAVSSGSGGAHLGGVVTNSGPSAAQQTTSIQGAALGNPTKVTPSGLFIRNPDPNGSYLYEARPQFADQQQWTSSDYLLRQLSFDPATTQKRLGDGFYEQRLVREQLAELTGHTPDGGASDDSTYLRLLTNAVSFAKEVGLRPGVALSAEQVSHLTSDIVWMESQNVMLPDGSVETVLVPKVYLAHVGQHAVQPGGALVTGNGVAINTTESIVNSGGVIDGGNGRTLLVASQDILNHGGSIKGGSVVLAADRDIKNESLAVTETYNFGQNGGGHTSLSNLGTISSTGTLDIMAGRDLSDLAGRITADSGSLTAGRNIDFGTVRTGSTYQSQISGYAEKDSSTLHQVSQISTAGDLKIAATGDLNLSGTKVAIGTAGSGTGQLLAGGTINIAAVTNEINTSVQNDPGSKQYDKQVHQNQTLVGAGVAAADGLTIGAGILGKGAINITASSITAGDAIKLTASDSVNIVSAQEQHLSDTALSRTSSSFLKSKTTQQTDYVATSQAIGSTVSGKTVDISATKDINVLGSAIAGDGDVSLAAAGKVTIGASTGTVTEQHHSQVKESGFLSGNGFGFSIGTRTTTTDQSRDATTQSGQSRSMVGSLGGNLSIVAGDAIKVSGSDLGAGANMSLAGRSVTIDPGRDESNSTFKQKTVQDGLTFAIGGSVVNAIQTFQNMGSAAAQSKDTRLKALAAAAATMTAKDTVDDMVKNGPSVKVSLTIGHSESENTDVTASSIHSGSVLSAGNNLTIRATGGDSASNIDVIGSDVHAGGNVSLVADNRVNLLAAQDTESQHSQSKSLSAALGVAAEISSSAPKYGFTASGSASRGNVDGDGITQVNTHVTAGGLLRIASGGDTNLKGAVASGSQVIAEIKGDLNIVSLQDVAALDGKRETAGVSGTIGAGAGLSANVSQAKVHNDYASVQEQSGIRAGDGGFQVQVAGNTDLKGGVISSGEQAIKDGRNSMTTATLSSSDIQNRDSSAASGISLGANLGKNQDGGTFSPSVAPGVGRVSSSQGSVTHSGISQGILTVTDQATTQVVATLKRDVVTGKDSAQALTKAWAGSQALDEVGAQMQITSAALPRIAKQIGDFAESRVAELKKQGNVEEAAKWAEGGIYRVAAHAALGAMGGGIDGALGAAASAEVAPTLGKLQGAIQDKLSNVGLSTDAADIAAKLLAGGTAATIGGVIGGGVGAVTGLNSEMNNRQLHKSETDRLEALKRGKSPDAQHRLDAAACALARCADGVPTSDALYSKVVALQNEGQRYSAEQTALKATGEFVYTYMDSARDMFTSHAELLRRTSGAVNLGAGSLGVVGGGVVASGGAVSCLETLGVGCAVGAFGTLIATASAQQAKQGSQALFGHFESSEGQRVLNSLNVRSFPGEKDPLVDAGSDALKLGTLILAGKVIPKGLAVAEEIATSTRGSAANSAGVKSVGAEAESATARVNNNFYRDGEISPQSLSTSSNIVIKANPGKTTTVLGTYADDTGKIINDQLQYPKTLNYLEPKKGGFNLLNTPDELYETLGPDKFWKEVNEPFLKAAIDRNDDIYLATKPNATNTRNPRNSDGLSGFGREYKYLTDRGYVYDSATGKMCHGGCK